MGNRSAVYPYLLFHVLSYPSMGICGEALAEASSKTLAKNPMHATRLRLSENWTSGADVLPISFVELW